MRLFISYSRRSERRDGQQGGRPTQSRNIRKFDVPTRRPRGCAPTAQMLMLPFQKEAAEVQI